MSTSLDMSQVKELLSEKKGKKFMWILVGVVLAVAAVIAVLFLLKRKDEEDWDDEDWDDDDWDEDEEDWDDDEEEDEDETEAEEPAEDETSEDSEE